MQPDYVRKEMEKGAATLDEAKHAAQTVDQAAMEGGSVWQGGLELMERCLDMVALMTLRTLIHAHNADPEVLKALRALYTRLFKRVYKAKAALEQRCLAIDYKNEGNKALKQKRYDDAIEWYTKVALQPESSAWCEIARCRRSI